MRLSLLASIAVIASVLSGCVGPDESAADPPEPSDAIQETGPDPDDADGASEETQPETVEPTLVDTPVAYDGATNGALCLFAVQAGQCHMLVESPTAFHIVSELTGEPLRLSGELSWTPVSPLSEELHIALLVGVEDGWTANETTPYLNGPSPLAVDWDLAAYAGHELAFFIHGFQGAGNEYFHAGGELEQPFHVEFMLTQTVV